MCTDGSSNKERWRELLHSGAWGRKLGHLSACDNEKALPPGPVVTEGSQLPLKRCARELCSQETPTGSSLEADMEGMGDTFRTQRHGSPGWWQGLGPWEEACTRPHEDTRFPLLLRVKIEMIRQTQIY